MTTTLADLLTAQTVSDVYNTLLGVYQSAGFPVTAWQPFGSERTRLMAIATSIADVSGNYIPQIAAGGFVDYASPGWLKLLAQELYSIDFNIAAFTQGNIVAANVAGGSAVNYTAGQLIAVFTASGNRYFNTSAGTIAAGGGGGSTTTIAFQAEFSGKSYADLSSQACSLATPIPGVSITNPSTSFSTVIQVGSGTGTVVPSSTPATNAYFIVRIDASGAAGTAIWSYALNGAPFVSAGAVAALANAGGTGITITLTGALTTSFIVDDTYQFASPAPWITQVGADEETTAPAGTNALATRCRDRWSSLSPIPTNSFYELIATSTPTVGSQVTQVIVQQDSVINNQVNIVVAGPTGILPAGTITAIQTYVAPRVPITDRPVVQSPAALAIVIGGTLLLEAALSASAQSAVKVALADYILGVGINSKIRIAALIELAMEQTGVVDFSSVSINSQYQNLQLGSSTTFQVATIDSTTGFNLVATTQ